VATIHHLSPGTGSGELNHQVELIIGGMTCASCAARVERKLNRLEGVSASVNYATEKARVNYADGVTPEDLVATVARTGYTAELPANRSPDTGPETGSSAGTDGTDLRVLRERLVGSAVLAIQVIAMSMVAMVPGLQVPHNFESLSLCLTAPVVVWGAWPFHRAAWQNLRHGAATMDTLISMGVLVAFLWSCYAWFVAHSPRADGAVGGGRAARQGQGAAACRRGTAAAAQFPPAGPFGAVSRLPAIARNHAPSLRRLAGSISWVRGRRAPPPAGPGAGCPRQR
jgi:copper chaperone CopZ